MIYKIIITAGILALGYVAYRLHCSANSLKDEVKRYKYGIKSAYVKFGKTFEHFAPFTDKFPCDKEKAVFLGMPIDYIAFDEDSIKFIEVKTGSSMLSPKQNKIKNLINQGKVEFKEVRY